MCCSPASLDLWDPFSVFHVRCPSVKGRGLVGSLDMLLLGQALWKHQSRQAGIMSKAIPQKFFMGQTA